MASNELQRTTGRLVEIRARSYRTVADVDEMIAMIRAAISAIPPDQQAIICADWRALRIFPPAVADKALAMLTTFNPRVKKSVLLVASDAPTALLQMTRLVRESAHPARRLCTSADEALLWLRDTLTNDEFERARIFLAKAS